MKRRCLALFLSLVMVFSFTAPAYAEGTAVDGNIVVESTEPTIISEPDGNGDGFNAYEFDDVYDVGGDTEVITCADCGNEPCTCEKEPASVCETCGNEPCTCEPVADPQLCEVCNAEPCTCEEATVCETCGQEPCVCETEEPVACEVCSQIPCICEQEQPGVSDPVCPGDDTCTIEGCQNHNPPTPEACEECGETDGHAETCSQYEAPAMQPEPASLFENLMAAGSAEEMFELMNEDIDAVWNLTFEEVEALRTRIAELEPEVYEEYLAGESGNDSYAMEVLFVLEAVQANCECPDCGLTGEHEEDCPWVMGAVFANNVHNVTQDIWYDTLSAAVSAANNGDTIEVYNSFTETGTVKIQKDYLKIRAANGKNPTISWTKTDAFPVSGATSYNCIVIDTAVTNATAFGGGTTGTLTFDASKASDADNKGSRARVIMHCGKGNLNLNDGIVITGGNPGGGSYEDNKDVGNFPAWSGEVSGSTGFGAGIYMYSGTLNMSGGVIKDNYSLWGSSSAHNYVGGGGGVYVANGAVMKLTGGTITHNAAGSGGGGGILVEKNATLEMTGGEITYNVTRFASGGGLATRSGFKKIELSGGKFSNNEANGYGGAIHTETSTSPITLTGNIIIEHNKAFRGGGINLWSTGAEENDSKLIISGNAQITHNSATENGGGVNVNRKIEGGAIYGSKAYLEVQSGLIAYNVANEKGGGINMQPDSYTGSAEVNNVEVTGGTILDNNAACGGGLYLAEGYVQINGGTFSKNHATADGGAICINNGSFIMTDGEIGGDSQDDGNIAANGGALYISGGNVTIFHGILNNNSATDGGAVYMDGDSDTRLYFKSGQMNENYAADDGGAIYATGGILYIGLEDCPGQTRNNDNEVTAENNEAHKALDSEGICQYHPQIQGNEAEDVGGGIALAGQDASSGTTGETLSGGTVHFYCGVANTNKALYKGVGLNVFMQGGEFHYYEGTNIGEPHDPDLVIVGGKLINEDDTTDYVYLYYYNNNTEKKDEPDYIGMAKLNRFMNLPEGEYFWKPAANEVFVGWTPYGPDATEGRKSVRDKNDYKPSGTSVQINDTEAVGGPQGTYDGKTDTAPGPIMHLYAVWAPETNYITYVDSLTDAESSTTPSDGTAQYTLKKGSSQTITIPATNSAAHPGFAIVGWYLYQDLNQNANWCDADYKAYEPAYTGNTLTPYSNLIYDKAFGEGGMMYYPLSAPNADLVLTVDPMTFGNITLVAKYELQYSDLTITKQGAQSIDENQAFLFNLIGSASAKSDQTIKNADALEMISALEDLDMQVVIEGDGSIVIKHLPLGTYTVTENGKWSWRYGETSSNPANGQVTLGLNDPKTVTFTNTRTKSWWLSGDWYTENWWGEKSIRREDEYIDPTKVKTN